MGSGELMHEGPCKLAACGVSWLHRVGVAGNQEAVFSSYLWHW